MESKEALQRGGSTSQSVSNTSGGTHLGREARHSAEEHWLLAHQLGQTHVASVSGAFGLPDPTPVGLHLSVYTSPMWSVRLWSDVSCFKDQILAVRSSEQEASSVPLPSH